MLILGIVYLEEVLAVVNRKSGHIRNFVHQNSGLFSIAFLSLFFLEQLLLILILYYFLDTSSAVQLLISVFALIVLTTATLEKFILEKKNQYLLRETHLLSFENQKVIEKQKQLLEENNQLKITLKKKR